MFDPYKHEVELLISILRDAGRLAKLVRAETDPAGLIKDDLSPVTVADFAIQALAARRLAKAFPVMMLVAEEDSAALRKPEGKRVLEEVTRFVGQFEPDATPANVCEWIDYGLGENTSKFWTLDPIDGTKGFLRGGQYAVALALLEDGQPILGGLACPAMGPDAVGDGDGLLVIAERRQGAWSQPLFDPETDWCRLRVSPCDDPKDARMMRSFEKGHTNTVEIDAICHAMGLAGNPVPMDSQAKYAAMAAGNAELLLRLLSPSRPDYKEKIWDHAAGALILEEAGGKVTDLHGKPLDFTHGRSLVANTGMLASNTQLHDAALRAVRRAIKSI